MVELVSGNLFGSKAQTLVNAVNCVGVMGKGIALDFKKKFPEMYRDYQLRCEQGQVKLGEPYLFKSSYLPWILNFPTKGHWRSASQLEDIERGLEYLKPHYQDWGISSLAMPALGCGNGQLSWNEVEPVLLRHLSELDIKVELFLPFGMNQTD